MGKSIIHIIFSPLFVSLLLASVIIYLLPPIFNKHNVSLYKKEFIINSQYFYCDLDGDYFSEKIEIETSLNDFVQLRVYENEKVIDQWNFNGMLLGGNNPICGDINADRLKEIMIFSYHDGRIFLNAINPFTSDTLVKNRIIAPYKPVSIKTDCSINLFGFYDENNDGFNEIYFSIATGYSIKPRIMFAFDYIKDTLYNSNNGNNIVEEPVGYDLDNDGKLEFFGRSAAVGNAKPSAKFSDHFSWLMVFNEKMEFEFEPIQIGFYPSRTYIKPFTIGNKKRIIIFNKYQGNQNHKSYLALYNSEGKKIKEKILENFVEIKDAELFQHGDDYSSVFLIKTNGEISEIDSNLNILPKLQLNTLLNSYILSIDIDNDTKNESVLFLRGSEQIIILRHDFSSPTIINSPVPEKIDSYSLKQNGKEKPALYLQYNNVGYYYLYEENPFYSFKYLFYAGIYGVLFLLVWGIQRTQRYRIEQKFEAEKSIGSLQLKAIKNQVDPHFTLNIINSIGSLIYKNDKDKADYVFGKFSKLLRSTLLNSERIITTLAEELEYVKNYLDLERFRMNEKFTYEINLDDNINQSMKIPRMLIHTFVENSIKHGIKHLDSYGKIEIIGSKNESTTTIKIIDNGIGREKAKELSEFSTGKGMRIIDQIIELYHKLEGEKIAYEIIDKNGQGTEIIVTVSYE